MSKPKKCCDNCTSALRFGSPESYGIKCALKWMYVPKSYKCDKYKRKAKEAGE